MNSKVPFIFLVCLASMAALAADLYDPNIINNTKFIEVDCPEKADSLFLKCEDKTISKLHIEARIYLLKAVKILESKNYYAQTALMKYFGIYMKKSEDQKWLDIIRENLKKMASDTQTLTYQCEEKNKSLWCLSGSYALVPIMKDKILICPNFSTLSDDKKLGVILHEWGHYTGGNRIDYLFEDYMVKPDNHFGDVVPSKRVRQADAYMHFIYFLAHDNKKELERF